MDNSLAYLVEKEEKKYKIVLPNPEISDTLDILPGGIPRFVKLDVSGLKSPASLTLQISNL